MSLDKIVEFAKSRIGCGYVYGATGWVCSPGRRSTQAEQYPQYRDTILNVCSKWDGKPCYDCAQLVKAACREAGVSLPSGATSQWKAVKCWAGQGEISTMPDEPGIILFRRDGERMQHVEVYVGGGYTVGARSSKTGVGRFPLKGYAWTHWARPNAPGVIPAAPETVKAAAVAVPDVGELLTVRSTNGLPVNLRARPNLHAALIDRVAVGRMAQVVSVDGEWTKITTGKLTGWMKTEFLERG